MSCEDWPCCGHEHGFCPSFDEDGNQLDMKCTCGKSLPVNSRYSICNDCMNADDEDPHADAWEEEDEEVDSDDDDHPYYDYEDEHDDHDYSDY